MGSSYMSILLHCFIYLATRPLLAAITTPHRLHAPNSVAMTSSVAPHSMVVLGLLLLAELATAQRAPKMLAVIRQRQE
jgi:hypothetical protein